MGSKVRDALVGILGAQPGLTERFLGAASAVIALVNVFAVGLQVGSPFRPGLHYSFQPTAIRILCFFVFELSLASLVAYLLIRLAAGLNARNVIGIVLLCLVSACLSLVNVQWLVIGPAPYDSSVNLDGVYGSDWGSKYVTLQFACIGIGWVFIWIHSRDEFYETEKVEPWLMFFERKVRASKCMLDIHPAILGVLQLGAVMLMGRFSIIFLGGDQ